MRYLLMLTAILVGCDLQQPNPFLSEEEVDAGCDDAGGPDAGDVADSADAACAGRYDPDCIPQEYRAASNVWPPGHAQGPVVGERAWDVQNCGACHGRLAEGGLAVPLAGTTLSDAYLIWRIREGLGIMAGYTETQLPNDELWGIVTWLRAMRDP